MTNKRDKRGKKGRNGRSNYEGGNDLYRECVECPEVGLKNIRRWLADRRTGKEI